MTNVESRTDDWINACADSTLTSVGLGTGVAVVAGAAVCFGWVRADPGVRIADAGVMTLIACGTDNRVIAGTDTLLASIGLRTGAPIVTGGAVSFGGVGANTIGWIANPNIMTLVERGADDRRAGYASAALASIVLSTSVTVCARRAVWCVYRRRTE
jgi:hypothetical protein